MSRGNKGIKRDLGLVGIDGSVNKGFGIDSF